NLLGSVQVVVDVVGWYDTNRTTEYGRFVPLAPARILDTRTSSQPFGEGDQRTIPLASHGGLPASGFGAVTMNVTATDGTKAGYLTVYPGGSGGPPVASNLNFGPGQTVPNFVAAQTPPNGLIVIYNPAGVTDVIVDVFGYFTGPSLYGFDTCEAPPV